MGIFPAGLFSPGEARQRLPVYEPMASPISNKERYSDDELSSDEDDEDDHHNNELSDDEDENGYYSSTHSSPSSGRGSRYSSGTASTSTLMLPKRAVAAAAGKAGKLAAAATRQQQRRRRASSMSAAAQAALRRYRLPNRIVRCFCIGVMMTIAMFIALLVRASVTENRRIIGGLAPKAPSPPPPWESFDFLTRYYGGLRSLVPADENTPQYPREEDETPLNATSSSDGAENSDDEAAAAPRVHLHAAAGFAVNSVHNPLPPSRPFNEQYNKSVFAQTKSKSETDIPIHTCFLDHQNTVRVPLLRYYEGRPNGFPQNVMGSYDLLSLSDDICFDRYGRLGPYGYGYSVRSGGLGVGQYGEREGADAVWDESKPVNYKSIDWAEVQRRCYQANVRRFKPTHARNPIVNGFYIGEEEAQTGKISLAKRGEAPAAAAGSEAAAAATESVVSVPSAAAVSEPKEPEPKTPEPKEPEPKAPEPKAPEPKKPEIQGDAPRTAVVVRCWDEFKWREEDILNLRALITELSLASGAKYDVHLLVQVKDDAKHPIWADEEIYRQRIEDVVPAEFRGLATLWTETQMLSLYQGIHDLYTRGPGLPVHGVYRGLQMAMQHFAHMHPEYAYFWQWEMDIRYTGHMLDLFSKMEQWALKQPRKGLWERNARFYVPAVHGNWDDFRQMTRVQSEASMGGGAEDMWKSVGAKKGAKGKNKNANKKKPTGEAPVWGPVRPADPNDWFEPENDPVPPTSYEKDHYDWGVDEEADLITLNPLFDPAGTTWLLSDDITGYNETAEALADGDDDGVLAEAGVTKKPPRRAQIITASRMSARLLRTMHRETALAKHHAFSEMWPATAALQHGYKAVYVPHPVYVDREWPLGYMARVFNGGRNGASGGSRTSVFGQREHNFRGLTWYYNAGFSPNLYRRWLGLRVNGDGGDVFEQDADPTKNDTDVSQMRGGEGRMCLPPMLLHPIKGVELPVESHVGDEPNSPGGDPSM